MRLSQYHLPVIKNEPNGAHTIASKLMVKAGLVRQISSGLYSWLPFGASIINNICAIIREELNKAGAQEVIMPCIQPLSLWQKSGRYSESSDLSSQMLKIKDRHGEELTFTPTAEELVCELMKNDLQSYKSLPKNVYQIQWKFRDEIRPRYGVMRAREFLMKDAYSFCITKEESLRIYEQMLNAYMRSYRRMGLSALPVSASSGAIGGDYSHEFHVLAETGESNIFYESTATEILSKDYIKLEDLNTFYTAEEDKHTVNIEKNPVLLSKNLRTSKGIEVGHLFYLGQKYSTLMDLKVQDKTGQLVHPNMGCYGIGVSRLVAAVIESSHDQFGMILPSSISPFASMLINLAPNDDNCCKIADEIYQELMQNRPDITASPQQHAVLYDDTPDNLKTKLDRADLIGVPYQIIVGPRNIANGQVEIKARKKKEIVSNNTELIQEQGHIQARLCDIACIVMELKQMIGASF